MDLAYEPTPRDRDAERARLDARLDSILDCAGHGRILEPEPADPAAEMEAALLRAGARDWRAALAWLQHSPSSRELWSDAAKIHALYCANSRAFIAGVDLWQAKHNIPPQLVRDLLLALKAAGTVGVDEAEVSK